MSAKPLARAGHVGGERGRPQPRGGEIEPLAGSR